MSLISDGRCAVCGLSLMDGHAPVSCPTPTPQEDLFEYRVMFIHYDGSTVELQRDLSSSESAYTALARFRRHASEPRRESWIERRPIGDWEEI